MFYSFHSKYWNTRGCICLDLRFLFSCNQNTSVPKACDTLIQLSTSTNGQENHNALSALARKLNASKKIQLETATTWTTDTKNASDDSNVLPFCCFLMDSDILKPFIRIIGTLVL